MRSILCAFLALTFSSCSNPPPHNENGWQEISGRGSAPRPLYRIRVPSDWTRTDASKDARFDTREPLVRLEVGNGVAIVIHSFPSASIDKRIPPAAQVQRWHRQLPKSSQALAEVRPIAFSGYAGLQLKAPGLLAIALSLGADQYQRVHRLGDEQLCADITIKATGEVEALRSAYEEIVALSRSFTLIDEIPSR